MTKYYLLPAENAGEPDGLWKSSGSSVAIAGALDALCLAGVFPVEITAKEAAKLRRRLVAWEAKMIKEDETTD